MTLYFQDGYGDLREIASIDGPDICKEVGAAIRRFCEAHRYTIPYTRIWNAQENGEDVTVYDVGSHTEFFIVKPAIPFESWKGTVI